MKELHVLSLNGKYMDTISLPGVPRVGERFCLIDSYYPVQVVDVLWTRDSVTLLIDLPESHFLTTPWNKDLIEKILGTFGASQFVSLDIDAMSENFSVVKNLISLGLAYHDRAASTYNSFVGVCPTQHCKDLMHSHDLWKE